MGAIFISYRCDDSEGHAGRLAGDLTERFGRDAVFFDVDTIAPGEDFRRAIDDNVARCSVLLAQTNDEDTATRKAAMARLLAGTHPRQSGCGAGHVRPAGDGADHATGGTPGRRQGRRLESVIRLCVQAYDFAARGKGGSRH